MSTPRLGQRDLGPNAGPHTVVVGGGLAGISAALELADAGHRVTLLESRPRLGGAAFSFQRGDLSVDNGQHVFLRCCEHYRWLLSRVGAVDDVVLQHRLDIPVLRADGARGRLRRQHGVPAPAHLGAALLGYRLLTPGERLRAGRAAVALRLLDPADPSLDDQTLGEFLRRHGQSERAIEALWGIVATATLNLPPEEASLLLAAKVFRTGLLDHAPAADVGHAAVPLGDIHSGAAGRALQRAGVEVLLRHRVQDIAAADTDPTVRAESPDGSRTWTPDSVVLAVPPTDAFGVLPQLAQTAAAPAAQLETSPIVNVHVIFDRRVTDLSFAAAVQSPVHWFFDRSESSGLSAQNPRAQYLAVTVSAAVDIIDTPAAVLRDRYVAELRRLLPAAARAEVLDAFVTRERRATFRQAAGTARLRPGADAAQRPGPEAGLPRVVLAGAWTDTGWPDTMESAVRSGRAAASQVLRLPAATLAGRTP